MLILYDYDGCYQLPQKFLVSLVGNQWCFLFPNVFRATSYIKTTNGIIKEIDTVLELEEILEIVLVFTLQKVTEVQRTALHHPVSLSLGMAQQAIPKCVLTPCASLFLLSISSWSSNDSYLPTKVQILEHGPSRSAKIFFLLEHYFPCFTFPFSLPSFFRRIYLQPLPTSHSSLPISWVSCGPYLQHILNYSLFSFLNINSQMASFLLQEALLTCVLFHAKLLLPEFSIHISKQPISGNSWNNF